MSWKTPKYTLIQPEQFKERFDVDSLLSSLSRDTARGGKSGKPVVTEGPAILSTAKASLERVERILKNLDRCAGARWAAEPGGARRLRPPRHSHPPPPQGLR
jgi:hypothetical protein